MELSFGSEGCAVWVGVFLVHVLLQVLNEEPTLYDDSVPVTPFPAMNVRKSALPVVRNKASEKPPDFSNTKAYCFTGMEKDLRSRWLWRSCINRDFLYNFRLLFVIIVPVKNQKCYRRLFSPYLKCPTCAAPCWLRLKLMFCGSQNKKENPAWKTLEVYTLSFIPVKATPGTGLAEGSPNQNHLGSM